MLEFQLVLELLGLESELEQVLQPALGLESVVEQAPGLELLELLLMPAPGLGLESELV